MERGRDLPGSLDLEGVQVGAFALDERVFDHFVDPAATWAALEGGAEFSEVFFGAGYDDFDVTVFSVADPAFEVEFAGLAMDEPAEAYALYSAFY